MAKNKSLGMGWCTYKKKIEQGKFISFEGVECSTDNPKMRNVMFSDVFLHKKGSLRRKR